MIVLAGQMTSSQTGGVVATRIGIADGASLADVTPAWRALLWAHIVMAYIVMAYIVMVNIIMAYIVIAHIVMTHMNMVHIVTAIF